MKPAKFQYHRPETVAEAAALLHELGDEAKLIGGGQSLLPIMNMRLAEPSHLVDVAAVPELRTCTLTGTGAVYGGATTHMMIEDELVPDVTRGLMPQAATGIGYRAIRTRGTLGGSLAHSDSSAEWPTVLSALDATVHAVSTRGLRRIPVRDLLVGFFTTTLEEDELIASVEVPRLASRTRWGLYKQARKPGEFAESLAVVLRSEDSDQLWLGAARDVPVRLHAVESLIADRPTDTLTAADLLEAVEEDTGTEGHTRQLHAVAAHRALRASRREETHV